MSAYERGKEKYHPQQVDLNSHAAENSQEQTKPGAEVHSDKKSPAPKSADSDTDRKKFFQSLLQSKNGPKVETNVPNTIPEESESEPNSPRRGETQPNSDHSTSVVEPGVGNENIHSECNGDEKSEHAEERPSKEEDSLSATNVSSEVRGAEIAEQSTDQRTELPDKEPNSDSNEIGERQAETSNISENNVKDETKIDICERSTTLSSTETTPEETDQLGKSDDSVDKKPAEPSIEDENKETPEELPSSENKNGESPENQIANDSTPPEQLIENHASSKEGKDLLDEKDKPKDVDSSLTIAVKSSYIGASCETSEDTQSKSEATEVNSQEEKNADPSESVSNNKDKSPPQSEEKPASVESSPASSPSKPSQPGSPCSASHTGADSSPASTASGAAAGTSNGGSPDAKAAFRAYVNIPEYLWSPIHQRLLGDLLFAIESDVQVWRR